MVKFSVFGANGRIGSAFSEHVSADPKYRISAMPRHIENSSLNDLGHVIFAAGLTADFRTRPYDTMRAHVSLLSDVLEYGSFESLTYLSSTRLYQNAETTAPSSNIAVNSANPSDLYTLSKLSGEALCFQAGKNVRIARLSNVVGPKESYQDTFIGQITKEALNGEILLKSALNSEKDYIWLYDVVDLLKQMPFLGREKIYNLASGTNITHQEWTDALQIKTNCKIAVEENAVKTDFKEIDITTTKTDFDFQSKTLLDKITQICSI
ncbi:MAG: NAD-dependent epimerase/dehydratase family protein [Nitratireductor sp.]